MKTLEQLNTELADMLEKLEQLKKQALENYKAGVEVYDAEFERAQILAADYQNDDEAIDAGIYSNSNKAARIYSSFDFAHSFFDRIINYANAIPKP